MTYKHIEAAREIRLWIGQIIVPTTTLVIGALSIPEVRQVVAAKAELMKRDIDRKLNK